MYIRTFTTSDLDKTQSFQSLRDSFYDDLYESTLSEIMEDFDDEDLAKYRAEQYVDYIKDLEREGVAAYFEDPDRDTSYGGRKDKALEILEWLEERTREF